MPTTDIYTLCDFEMIAEVHLPVVEVGDVAVEVDGRKLVIREGRHQKAEEEGKDDVLRETSQCFYRRLTLPARSDQRRVSATFDEGILRITIPHDGMLTK